MGSVVVKVESGQHGFSSIVDGRPSGSFPSGSVSR